MFLAILVGGYFFFSIIFGMSIMFLLQMGIYHDISTNQLLTKRHARCTRLAMGYHQLDSIHTKTWELQFDVAT